MAVSATNIFICIANNFLLPTVGTALGVAINPMKIVDSTNILLTQIRNEISQLQQKVDLLMLQDFKGAVEQYKNALLFLESPDMYKQAYEECVGAAKKGAKALNLAPEFDKKILCKRIVISAKLMSFMFDEKTNTFVSFHDMSSDKQKTIASYVYDQTKGAINDFNALPVSSFWFFQKQKKDEDRQKNQDFLDKLLKNCLPLIWFHIDIFKRNKHDSQALLEFIPEGLSDAADIFLTNDRTKSGLVIKVWKEKTEKTQKLQWRVKVPSKNVTFEEHVQMIDECLLSSYSNCINASSAFYDATYEAYKRKPSPISDKIQRESKYTLFFKFCQFPIFVFKFYNCTQIVALDVVSMTIKYCNLEARELFDNKEDERFKVVLDQNQYQTELDLFRWGEGCGFRQVCL